jgi:hypothetical protein
VWSGELGKARELAGDGTWRRQRRQGAGAAVLLDGGDVRGGEGSSARETTKWKLLDMSKCRTSEETDEAEGPMHRARDLASQRRGHRVDLIEGDRRGWLTLSGVRTLLPKAPQK